MSLELEHQEHKIDTDDEIGRVGSSIIYPPQLNTPLNLDPQLKPKSEDYENPGIHNEDCEIPLKNVDGLYTL